jgi:glutathione S-transferase
MVDEASLAYLISIICLLTLLLKHVFTVIIQGSKRTKAGSRAPEDASGDVKQNFITETTDAGLLEAEQRWQRIVQNDLENIPIGLLITFASLIAADYSSPITHIVFVCIFTVSRILHTFSYAYGKQPWRSLSWMFGVIAMFGMVINGLVGACYMFD